MKTSAGSSGKTQKQMAEAVLIPLDQKANPNSKDSVFCDLFRDPQYLLQLYSALHPEDDITNISDITLVTLENQMLRIQYNDLGFIVGNRLLVLIEEQSVWTVNILIRILMYLGETYKRYVKNNNLDVYGTKSFFFQNRNYMFFIRENAEICPMKFHFQKMYSGFMNRTIFSLISKQKSFMMGNRGISSTNMSSFPVCSMNRSGHTEKRKKQSVKPFEYAETKMF